jgi:hypothetical protein
VSELPHSKQFVAIDFMCGKCEARGKWSRLARFGRNTGIGDDREPWEQGVRVSGEMTVIPYVGEAPNEAAILECAACGYVPPRVLCSEIAQTLDHIKPDENGQRVLRVSL